MYNTQDIRAMEEELDLAPMDLGKVDVADYGEWLEYQTRETYNPDVESVL